MKIFEYQTIVSGTGYNFKEYVDFVYGNYATGPIIKQYMCDVYSGDNTVSRKIVPPGNTTRLKFAIVFCGYWYIPNVPWRSVMFVSYRYDMGGGSSSGMAIQIYDDVFYSGIWWHRAAISGTTDVLLALDSGFIVSNLANRSDSFYYYIVYW